MPSTDFQVRERRPKSRVTRTTNRGGHQAIARAAHLPKAKLGLRQFNRQVRAVSRERIDARDERPRHLNLARGKGPSEPLPMPSEPVAGAREPEQHHARGLFASPRIRKLRGRTLDEHRNGSKAIDRAHIKRTGGNLHFLGLVSDGQVHSDLAHLLALIDFAAKKQDEGALGHGRLFIHAITDGRDTPPNSARGYLATLDAHLAARGSDHGSDHKSGREVDRKVGRIATVIGRFYAMDRDHRWDRVKSAFEALTQPIARRAENAVAAVVAYHTTPSDASRASDEFVLPTQLSSEDDVVRSRIRSGDAVLFFNFRGDRPRELTKAFVLDDAAWSAVTKGGFDRGARLHDLFFATLAEYEKGLPVELVFRRPPKMENILGSWLASHGVRQFRCAETEKFPHVTFFFNDYREEPFAHETREIVPSPTDVATYDLKPEMSAEGVCAAVLARLHAADCEQVLIVNFANADMVGHTGNLAAATRAVEVVDGCVGRIIDALLARGGSAIVTADHGNAEEMWNVDANCPHTAHTNYTVPCSIIGRAFVDRKLRTDGRLADLAPTLLDMIDLAKPAEMTGKSLLV